MIPCSSAQPLLCQAPSKVRAAVTSYLAPLAPAELLCRLLKRRRLRGTQHLQEGMAFKLSALPSANGAAAFMPPP